jgi:nucleoid-associated protein YgaU
MKKQNLFLCLSGLSLAFVLTGCVVRTYPLTKERVDQDITGNRGYLQGQAPAGEEKERKTSRTTRVVEIELRSPLKFERAKPKTEGASVLNGKGEAEGISSETQEAPMQKYTVQRNDTLQKISQKFYGTTKLWKWIYDANKDVLKAPNKIYPGQVINVPVTENNLKEPKENLK